ncbi:sensory transduction protein LytT [Robertmurraya siralis]|uniref:Sensory transduction protein LytT n=1 Tax=Robertmurraya siralis TaxID=77777 RepID=A0A919WLD6_9BACI|nr:LytTR family transcriptional regulator DNA-binding domain-containing protein [Robertmurraya siralis]PAE18967.1 DNA-binding response regulator [Bacillus sp. 7504-2]GIN64245.1 sensory transduction protein LytT [Robertmurraya siralis]
MLKAYIVDDEPLARDELKYLLNRSKEVEVIGEGDGIDVALMEITSLKPDLIFIDIELDSENGLSLAQHLEFLNPPPAIVFATAYDEYALQAFESNAVDYILKPFDENRLQRTLEKISNLRYRGQETPDASKLIKQNNDKLVILVDERIVLLHHDDILFLHSSEGKSTIKTIENEYKVSEPLVVLEKKLNNTAFIRVHRSFIVHMDHIVEIEPWFNSTYNLRLKDGSTVPVSRTYVKDLKRKIGF